jgi:hypothetical protein
MALLQYPVQESDEQLWGTTDSISSNLGGLATKLLSISTDPLVDPTVLSPEQAYQITNS